MIAESQLPEVVHGLIDRWVDSLAGVIASMADHKTETRWEASAEPPEEPEVLWWEQSFHGAAGAPLWVATPRAVWEDYGTITLKAAGLETVEMNEARNTWLEILGQSLSGLAQAMGAELGREISCEGGREHASEGPVEAGASIWLGSRNPEVPSLWIGFSPQLVQLLAQPAAIETNEAHRASPLAAPLPGTEQREVPPAMDLLLDVELPVSVSFGKTEIAMKDVLKLTTGSIVELNRGVNEPVEVLVNHCLIARGEVVVVEGNYGVRIQKIISRPDRLRSVR